MPKHRLSPIPRRRELHHPAVAHLELVLLLLVELLLLLLRDLPVIARVGICLGNARLALDAVIRLVTAGAKRYD